MKKSNLYVVFHIAFRYLFSKKKHHIVNILTIISSVGIMVSTAALIIVLSVFNGMEKLVTESVNSFNPDIKISPKIGKTFLIDSTLLTGIKEIKGVATVDEVVSDAVLLSYNERQTLLRLKGVENDYFSRQRIDSILIDGDFKASDSLFHYAVLGAIVAGELQVNLNSLEMVKCYYPRRTKKHLLHPTEAFTTHYLLPSGVFRSYTQYDKEYAFCSIDFVRELMEYDKEITALEVKIADKKHLTQVKTAIGKLLGDEFVIQDQFEQEELLFKTIKNEKLVVFAILSFILLVAAFNIIGTLGMLIIEKKEDIQILKFLGAKDTMIYRIFVLEGIFVSFIGGLLGMLIGFIICFLQQTFHLIELGENYIISYYPVQMSGSDFLIVLLTVVMISYLASRFPAMRVTRLLAKK